MAFIDLGKLKFNWRGEWNTTTDYEVDDVVFYDNHSFVCTTTHNATGTAPSANLSVWALMAAGVHFREDGVGLVQVPIIVTTLFVTTRIFIF